MDHNGKKDREQMPARQPRAPLDSGTFRQLVEDGQQFRRDVEKSGASSRVITPDDMKLRSR